MIDRHTLVIPTYNRPALLKRLVQYYCKRAGPMNLLVLDSSRPEVAQENANVLASYGDCVRHVVFPGTTPLAAKLSQGLALVQTPYASLCADDDLVFPKRLHEAVAFLDDHPDYVCAHGLYFNFSQAGHDLNLMREYAGPSNEANHPGARIFRLLQKYESLFYAAFRTPDLRDIVSAAAALPTLHYQELFQSVAAMIKGKVRRFPKFYAARQSCPPAEPEREKWQTYYWFADNPVEVLEHYRVYCGEIWKFYEMHGPLPHLEREPFFKILDLAHAVYFSAECPPEYFHSVLQQYWPEDGYFEVNYVDLFDRLRTAATEPQERTAAVEPPKWTAGLVLAVARHMRTAWTALDLARLNRNVRKACRTPWKCCLPGRLRWLAGVAEFRNTYLELCHYLDQS
jgi:glycosyltransferase domain-containing protein